MAKVSTAIATVASINVAACANFARLVVIDIPLLFLRAEKFRVFLYFLRENISSRQIRCEKESQNEVRDSTGSSLYLIKVYYKKALTPKYTPLHFITELFQQYQCRGKICTPNHLKLAMAISAIATLISY